MIGDLVLGIQCQRPVLFVLAGLFCSFVYINIIYALAVAFRHIGKAVAVILVIVQIPGASGLYPIEMMPDFFRELHPWLPFTYGINAMRGPIAGLYGNHYWIDMLHLFLYLPVALFIGLVVRRYALNLNALFDRRLAETDLMMTEHNAMVNESVSFSSILNEFSNTEELRKVIRRRAKRFFGRYPRLIRAGLALLIVLPFVFLILLFVIPNKVAMLTTWILSIIIIDAFLIVVEYMRDRYARQLGVSAMSADAFRDAVLRGYTHRHLTFRTSGGRRAGMRPSPRRLGTTVMPGPPATVTSGSSVNSTGLDWPAQPISGNDDAEGGNNGNEESAGETTGIYRPQAYAVRRAGGRDAMKNIWRIFTRDVCHATRNVIAIIVAMGLIIVPALYAWYNIAASWDPYGNTKSLKVAVANVDSGYKSDLIPVRVNIGETVVSSLRANHDLDWQFVDRDTAIDACILANTTRR